MARRTYAEYWNRYPLHNDFRSRVSGPAHAWPRRGSGRRASFAGDDADVGYSLRSTVQQRMRSAA